MPQSLVLGRAAFRLGGGGKWVDDPAVLAQAKVDMRKRRLAAQPDLTQHRGIADPLSRFDPDGPLLEMAILRLPPVAVRNHDPVAAFPALGQAMGGAGIRLAIPNALNGAGGCGMDRNASLHRGA